MESRVEIVADLLMLCRYKELEARDDQLGQAAMALYCATVRATLFVCKGYECQEKEVEYPVCIHAVCTLLQRSQTSRRFSLPRQLFRCSLIPRI